MAFTGNNALPETDYDKDGPTNLQEFAFNLNPTQPGVPVLVPGPAPLACPS